MASPRSSLGCYSKVSLIRTRWASMARIGLTVEWKPAASQGVDGILAYWGNGMVRLGPMEVQADRVGAAPSARTHEQLLNQGDGMRDEGERPEIIFSQIARVLAISGETGGRRRGDGADPCAFIVAAERGRTHA